jgi:hypothetical protein
LNNHLIADLAEIRIGLQTYLRHPVKEIRRLPDWNWRRILTAQLLVTTLTGAFSLLVSSFMGQGHHSALAIVGGLLEMPLLTLISLFVTTLFFYYVFQLFQQIFVEFRELYLAVFFANIPFFIFHIISEFFPPLLLIGLGFSMLLLIVAFVANFRISRTFATRLLAGIYALMVLMNLYAWWQSARSMENFRDHSLDRAPEVHLGK